MKLAGPATTTGSPGEAWLAQERAVEFYRVDTSRRILAIVLLCPIPVVAGLLLIARPMQGSFDPDAAWVVGLSALALVVTGPLSMMVALKRAFLCDEYLLVRTDGLVDHLGATVTLHPWDEVECVVYDGSADAVVLQRRDGGSVRLTRRYAGITPRELARRLDEVRRKAMFNLL
ncbi:MAG: hypothetical protein ACOCV4_02485 [Myxococcota bacterium]